MYFSLFINRTISVTVQQKGSNSSQIILSKLGEPKLRSKQPSTAFLRAQPKMRDDV